ncbi:MAG: hypothetical protein ACM31C_33800 [Acidobacteriota bacterium]
MRRLLVSLLTILALAGTLVADPADKPKADSEAQAAQQAYEAGKYHDAATHFAAAYQLDPQPAYLFNTAQAYRFAKECANAADYYRKFLDATKQLAAQNLDKVQKYLAEMDACVKDNALAPTTPAMPSQVTTPARAPLPEAPADPGRDQRRLGLAIGAAGIVGLVVGAYYTHRVLDVTSQAQAWANANCTQAAPCTSEADAQQKATFQQRGDAAQRDETIAYAVGGAAVAAGVVLYMLGSHRSDERAVAAVPTPGGALVTAGFAF